MGGLCCGLEGGADIEVTMPGG